MSYAVYTTRGWILGSAPTGEASKVYTIYTHDFGLVYARAQGVRLMQSKLRYGLGDYSCGTFSLVRGREFWRLTGVNREPVPDDSTPMRARILHLVKRLVHGEERNEELFSALDSLLEPNVKEVDALSRILSALGYLDLSLTNSMDERGKLHAINKALKETQL